jgi:acetoacetyl-CoA synthetase
MNPENARVHVRPVAGSEVPLVIEFLRNGFAPHLPADALRALFEYRWEGMTNKPNRGFALWSGVELVGFLGAVYASRLLAGQVLKTCNLSTWYVRPDFRWAAMKLLYAVMSQKDYTITNWTASPAARRVMEGLGYQVIDRHKLVYLPWQLGREIFRRGPRLLTDPEDIAQVLKGEELQFLRDHLPCCVKHYLLCTDHGHSYMVLKRRSFPGDVAFPRIPIKKAKLMWYPCMEVLYLGNSQTALQNWNSLVAAILRREQVLGFVVAERFLGANAPGATRLDHRNYLLPRVPLSAVMDCLYSELTLLP